MIAHRHEEEISWFIVSSCMVAMGIAVANEATSLMGVEMRAAPNREVFNRELLAQIRREPRVAAAL